MYGIQDFNGHKLHSQFDIKKNQVFVNMIDVARVSDFKNPEEMLRNPNANKLTANNANISEATIHDEWLPLIEKPPPGKKQKNDIRDKIVGKYSNVEIDAYSTTSHLMLKATITHCIGIERARMNRKEYFF